MPFIRRVRATHGPAGPRPPRYRVPGFIRSATVPPRASLADGVAAGQMAEDMRDGCYREGGVTEHDLIVLGWSQAQIKRLADQARTIAQRRAGAC